MTQGQEPIPASPEALQLGYEPTRLRIRGFLIFLISFVAAAAIVQLLVWLFMKTLEHYLSASDTPRSIVAPSAAVPTAPLQPSVNHDTFPYQDLQTLRAGEDATFEKFGWQVNRATHEADIPQNIVDLVIREQKSRAAAGPIPPTTTGRDTNSIGGGR